MMKHNLKTLNIASDIHKMSLGYSFELQTQLLIAYQNNYLTEERTIAIENKIIEFQKMITSFVSKLEYSFLLLLVSFLLFTD